ncbi:SRPBCC domain-containing protein [Cyclobacterium xiamenense]|uniref:SRPBCC domain-containing protein n=1 Tax=Cyclobacterium xiamenense TaxID=1297121 RepID=UPI0035D0D972
MKDFYTEIFINAPSDQVWKAFVGPNQFFMAFFQADIRSTFKTGDRIEYAGMCKGQEVVYIYGEVLEYEEGKLLSYTDHPRPIYKENHADLQSRVRVTLESLGQSTRMTLKNDQFTKDNPMQEEARQWYLILSNFKTWLETGNLMDIPNQ